jgi:hypothetical protein
MVLVQHPVELSASPRRPQVEPHLDGLEASAQGLYRETPKVPTLQARPGGPMHASQPRAVGLAQATTPTQNPYQPAELQITHVRQACGDALTGDLSILAQ